MSKFLTALFALAFATATGLAQAAPKAAEDPTATVMGTDTPAPVVKTPKKAIKAAPAAHARKGKVAKAKKAAPAKHKAAKKAVKKTAVKAKTAKAKKVGKQAAHKSVHKKLAKANHHHRAV